MAYLINEQCIGCTACTTVCPVKAISGEQRKRHSINEKRCVDCGVCGKVCPKGAIQDAAGRTAAKVPRAHWKKPGFDTTICSACSICVEICGFRCIGITPPKHKGDINAYAFLKDANKCVGCGMCYDACPLKAISMEGAEGE
jgi:formate hydrogenlyase subunit 6/NADH:ubiquinone oxidoreductase subunit I